MKLNLFVLLPALVAVASGRPHSSDTCKGKDLLEDLKESGPEECCAVAYKPACTMNLERMWHVKLFYKRKPGLSEEEFNRHWAYEHTRIAEDTHLRNGIVRYSQHHSTEQFRNLAGDSIPILDFDGSAEFWVHDLESMQKMQADPHYVSVMVPDEAKFIDPTTMKILVGVDYIHIDNGDFVKYHAREF